MNYHIQYGLPFVTVIIQFRGQRLILEKVLLDTGSAGTIFNTDVVGAIGVIPESEDVVDTIRVSAELNTCIQRILVLFILIAFV